MRHSSHSDESLVPDEVRIGATELQKSILTTINTQLPNWYIKDDNSITFKGLVLSISHEFTNQKYTKLEGGDYNKLKGGRYKKCEHIKRCDCVPVPLYCLSLYGDDGQTIYSSSGKMALSDTDLNHQLEAVKTQINSYFSKLKKTDITAEVMRRTAIEKQHEAVFLADELKQILLDKLLSSIHELERKEDDILVYKGLFNLSVNYYDIPPFVCSYHKKLCDCKPIPIFRITLIGNNGVVIFSEDDIQGVKPDFENYSSRSYHIRNIKSALKIAIEEKNTEDMSKNVNNLSFDEKISLVTDAINQQRTLKIIYHGGTQPGTIREIIPKKFDYDKLVAICLITHKSKSFFFHKTEILDHGEEPPISNDYQASKKKKNYLSSEIEEALSIKDIQVYKGYQDENKNITQFPLPIEDIPIQKKSQQPTKETFYHPSCFEKENNFARILKKSLSIILITFLSSTGLLFGLVSLIMITDSDETDIATIIVSLIFVLLFGWFTFSFVRKAKRKGWI